MTGPAAGLLFVVLLVLFVMRRPKAAAVSAQLQEKPVILPGHAPAEVGAAARAGAGDTGAPKLAGGQQEGSAETDAAKELEEVMPLLQLPAMNNRTKQLLDHFRKNIQKDPEAAVNVIRNWIEEV